MERCRRRFLEDQRIYVSAVRDEKASEIARNMKRLGSDADFIAQATGLFRVEISKNCEWDVVCVVNL